VTPFPLPRLSRRRTTLLLSGAALAGAAAWFVWLPVPLGWAYRLAAAFHRGGPSTIRGHLRSATFYWKLGHPACLLVIRGVDISSRNRTLARLEEVDLELPKGDLLTGHGAVARATVKGASVLLELADLQPSSPTESPSSGRPVDLMALAGILPRTTGRTELVADGLDLRIRLAKGDAPVHLPRATTTVTSSGDGKLRLDLSLAVGPGPSSAVLKAAAVVNPKSGRVELSLRAPTFRTGDLVTFPGRPWVQATVSADLKATFALSEGTLEQMSGGLRVADALLDLPGLRHPITVPLVEFSGFLDPQRHLARLESGRLSIGNATLTVAEFEASLGPLPSVRWQVSVDGIEGPLVHDLLSEVPSLHSAVSLSYLDALTGIRGSASGQADLARTSDGRWATTRVTAAGGLGARLGSEEIRVEAQARQTEASSPIRIAVQLSPLRIGGWPSPWRSALGLGGLEGTANLQADLSVAPTGRFQRIALRFEAGSTRLPAFRPGAPGLAFESIAATLESEDPAAQWRMPTLRVKLVDGPALTISDFSFLMAASEVVAKGTMSVAGLKGAHIGPWLPEGALSALDRLAFPGRSLTLAQALEASDLEMPIVLEATARGLPGRGLTGLDLGFHAESGHFSMAAAPSFDLPIDRLALDAHFDPAAGQFTIRNLSFVSAGVRLALSEATVGFGPAFRTSGRIDLAGLPVSALEAIYVAARFGPRERPPPTLIRAGLLESAHLRWATSMEAKGPTPLAIETLQGDLQLEGVVAAIPGESAPLQVRTARLKLDYPGIAAEVTHATWRSFQIPSAQFRVSNAAASGQPIHATAHLSLAFLPGAPAAALELAGTAEADGQIEGVLGSDAWRASLKANLGQARLTAEGTPILLPETFEAGLDLRGLGGTASKPSARFTLQASPWLGGKLDLAGRATLEPGDLRPLDIDLDKVDLGGTSVRVSLHRQEGPTVALSVDGPRLEAGPWLRMAVAVLDAAESTAGDAPARARPAEATTGPEVRPVAFAADVRCAEVDMGPGFVARDLRMTGRWDPRGSAELRLDATQGSGHHLNARLSGPPDARTVEIGIEDSANWARLLTSPWANRPPPAGGLAHLIGQLAEVPAIISGGDVSAEGTFNPAGSTRFTGHLDVAHAVVIHPPRILNLLALKSRRALQATAEIESLSLDQIVANQKELVIGRTSLRGTGFIGKLKITRATYGLVDEQLHIEGAFFGVGFEIAGTRNDPQVYLQDNALIRAFGRPNEFDFGPQPKK
jgi:hypothetical protein